MANIFFPTGGSFSGLTPQKVVASAFSLSTAYGTYQALNTARYITFTPSEAGNCEGIFVCLGMGATGSSSVTVVLQEQTAPSTWTDRATGSLTYDEIKGTRGNLSGPESYVYFTFASAYAITAVADTWRVEVSAPNTSARIRTTYSYGVVLTATTTYSSADNIFFKQGQAFTVDQNITWTNAMAGVGSTIKWDDPVASYTVTGTGLFYVGKDFRLEAGSEVSPILYTKQAIWNVTGWVAMQGHEGSQGQELSLWGEIPDDPYTKLASDAAASQANIVTTDDMSAKWSPGDTVMLLGRENLIGFQDLTIDSISGTTITFTGNLTAKHHAGWAVVNWTKAGKTGVVLSKGINGSDCVVRELSGVYIAARIYWSLGWNGVQDEARRTAIRCENDYIYNNQIYSTCGSVSGSVFKNLYFRDAAGYTGFYGPYITHLLASTLSDIYVGVSSDPGCSLSLTNATVTDLQVAGGYNSNTNLNSINLSVTSCTLTRVYGTGGWNCLRVTSINSNFISCRTGAASYYGLKVITVLDTTWTNCDFGNLMANGTDDVYFTSGYYALLDTYSCDFGAVGLGNITGAIPGSNLKCHEYDSTVNDHRCFYQYGNIVSTGDSLTDTTVHTSGTGKFAIRFEPTSSTNNLTWEFDVPTGDISTKTMTVAVWCKINNLAYYAGTHQLPRLTIDYDNGTTAYCQASESTDWQLLFVTFTPTTTYGQITVTLSGRTDATGSNAYIYWDDVALLYPAGVTMDLGGLDNWANALPVTPPVAIPISAYTVSNAVWEELITSHTTAGTMGKKLGKQLWNSTTMLGAS